MFGPKKISQSLIDAVLKITEEKPEVTRAPQLLDEADKVPTPTGMKVYGSRYGNSAKARRDQTKAAVDTLKGPKDKELIKDDEIDETGFHAAAHGAKKAGQTHFEFQGKKYPVTAKSHTEAIEEEGDCVTKPEAKKIAKKEVSHHNVTMHKGQKNTVKEDEEVKSFKDRLLEREMTSAESRKREKIVMSMKDKQEYFKKKYGKRWKEVMYATATKQAMKEDINSSEDNQDELDEASYTTKRNPDGSVKSSAVDQFIKAGGKVDKSYYTTGGKSSKTIRNPDGSIKKSATADFKYHKEEVKKSDVPAFLRKMRGDKPLTMKDVKSGDKDSISHKDNLAKARNEEIELSEKNESHTHAAHYENDKGEWTGMNLFVAKDDEDAIRQAHAKCKDGCRLSRVERHVAVKEEVQSLDEIEASIEKHSSADATTDMLRGRVVGGTDKEKGGADNFRKWKIKLAGDGENRPGNHNDNVTQPNMDNKGETPERQKITTNPGPVDIKFDDKLGNTPPQKYFSKEKELRSEEVKGELKHIRSKEKEMRNKEVSDFASHAKASQKESVEEGKNPQVDAANGAQPDFATEKVIAGTPGWKKVAKNVTDKSGAVHTPMSRAKDLARQAFKKVKNEMLGKAPGNNG